MAYGWSYSDNVIVAHAVLGGLLGMIIWPAMALSARFLRRYPHWTRVHYSIGASLALPVLVVVFALGTWHVGVGEDVWTTFHFRNGLVLLILGILQPIYGTLLHTIGRGVPQRGVKSLVRWFHPITGVVILALGWAQVYTGYGQWGKPGGEVPYGFTIAWAVLVGLWGVLYVGGFALLPGQMKESVKAEGTERSGYSP